MSNIQLPLPLLYKPTLNAHNTHTLEISQITNTLHSLLVTVEERKEYEQGFGFETSWVTLEGKGSFERRDITFA